MVDDFGSGIYLDNQFDLGVSSTGDLRMSEGIDELQKDLAFQMVLNLSRYLGRPPSGNLKPKVADTASKVALADDRVSSVADTVDVEFSQDREEIRVQMSVRTRGGQRRLIFNI